MVTIYRVGELPGGGVFIAMELIEGMTARAWMARARSTLEIVQLFLAAAEGLAAAHRVGLVHRDFKPDNLLVGHDGRICVSDFGIAWLATLDRREGLEPGQAAPIAGAHRARRGFVLGSPAYMAPEQILGEAVDARTDVFSYCVSLYEALCGRRPFAGESLSGLTKAIQQGRVPPGLLATKTSREGRDAILAGLSASPQQRPELAELIKILRGSCEAGGRPGFG